jgi:uncharacterized SAM-binding protein YcdF (DUF218 family)
VIRLLLLVIAALLVVWLVACAVLFVWPSAASSPRRADVVVVLSGDRNHRLDPALSLVRQGVAPLLVISSPGYDPKWRKARQLCSPHRHSTAFRVLCFEADPYSTRGEARAIGRLAREHHWRRVVVVTSTFHVTRARMLVKRCYRGALTMVGADSTWWRLPEEWASETGKLLVQLTLRRGC